MNPNRIVASLLEAEEFDARDWYLNPDVDVRRDIEQLVRKECKQFADKHGIRFKVKSSHVGKKAYFLRLDVVSKPNPEGLYQLGSGLRYDLDGSLHRDLDIISEYPGINVFIDVRWVRADLDIVINYESE
jgi:hypothetical protein